MAQDIREMQGTHPIEKSSSSMIEDLLNRNVAEVISKIRTESVVQPKGRVINVIGISFIT